MKRILAIPVLICCIVCSAFAQKESGPLPYNKQKLDSLFRSFRKLNLPYIFPVPQEGTTIPDNLLSETPNSFETYNPGATVINQTSRGTVYNMPMDNMAVLVPNMRTVEKMPGSNRKYTIAPPAKMPNPMRKEKKF